MIVRNPNACIIKEGPVRFFLGVNEITDEKSIKYLNGSGSFKNRCDIGNLEVLDEAGDRSKEPNPELTVSKLGVKAAVRVIRGDKSKKILGVLDRKDLLRLKDGETRPEVIVAIDKQLAEVSEPDKKPDDK